MLVSVYILKWFSITSLRERRIDKGDLHTKGFRHARIYAVGSGTKEHLSLRECDIFHTELGSNLITDR